MKCPFCDEPARRVTCGSLECQRKQWQVTGKKWKENFKKKTGQSYSTGWRKGEYSPTN